MTEHVEMEHVMKSFATFVFVLALLSTPGAVRAQEIPDKDAAKPTASPTAAARGKKAAKKDEKTEQSNCKAHGQDCPAHEEEKKPGMNAETFSGLKFRSIGPAVASGRVMSIAVNPRNKFEYYVGVASGGVWKTENDGTTWTPV